ncbi:MAG: AAA family ATPase, partial [Phycisphaerales bacterium]|nr:AAA family ATPase [Phycisphaerales bacterium]
LGHQQVRIQRAAQDSDLLVWVDGERFRLEQLGGGVAQLIMLLGSAAIARPKLILLDEPEISLHPSLQLDLLTTLGRSAEFGVAFATHNIGLARAAAARIYIAEKTAGAGSHMRPLEDHPRPAQLLGELQYGAYSQLGFERVLLVEGSTDVLVAQQYLRKLGIDHQVVILPLGGRSMITRKAARQLAEVCRICPKVAALIDSERSEADGPPAQQHAEFAQVCARLGISCHLTNRRATENYFDDQAVKRAFGKHQTPLGPFDNLKHHPSAWPKADNWKAAQHMGIDALDDVGAFLKRWCSDAVRDPIADTASR